MRILVDAMSGDNAPLEILKGASLAKKEYKDHTIVLVGDENVISDVAVKNEIDLDGIEIINSTSVITMEDNPLCVIPWTSIVHFRLPLTSPMRKPSPCCLLQKEL